MFKEFTDKIAVNCRMEQEAKEFLALLEKNGYVWFGGAKPTDHTNWETYKAKTCYVNDYNGSIGVEFCYSDYYKQHGYKILTYPEFLKLIGKEKPYTIVKHIIDGNKTVVVLSDKRTGVAWCSPEDKFDTLTGLNLAFKRAIGEEKTAEQVKAKKKEEIKVGDWVKLVDENALCYTWSDRTRQAAKNGVKVIQKDGFAILTECFYEKGMFEMWGKTEAFTKIPAPKGGAK